jgi:CheY-like chemotaxis protein
VKELAISLEEMEIPEGLSASEFAGLQELFLEEGVKHSRELLEGLDRHFDGPRIRQRMHQWVGCAGQLGFHDIAELARRGERSLGSLTFRESDVREMLSDLLFAFCDLRDKMTGVPDHFVQVLRGKSVAVIGFPEAQIPAACDALGRAGARARIFSASENLGCESVGGCDLVMVHVSAGMDHRKLQAAAEGPLAGKLVLAGERRHLTALPPAFQSLVADFLFQGWQADELLLRLAMASRRNPSSTLGIPKKAAFQAAEARPRAVTNTRVVAVDDDPIILALLGTTFRKNGIECETVNNGGDALRVIRQQTPSVVVLDVNMPGVDGFEVLSAIRSEDLPTQVVLLTARQQEHDVLRGFQLGADDYLVKPFSPPELLARINRLLVQKHKTAA